MALFSDPPAYDALMLAATELEADWLSHSLYESPWMIIIGLAILWTLLRIVGRRTDNTALRRASWAPLILIGALALTASLVTTKREQLNDTLDELLLSVEDRDFETFRLVVTDDAEAFFPPKPFGQRFTRDGVEDRLKDLKLRDLILLASESAFIDDKDAATYIRVRAQGSEAGIEGIQVFEWSIKWRYQDGQWRAYRFECFKIGFTLGQDTD